MSDYKGAARMIEAMPDAPVLIGDGGYDADWFRVTRAYCAKRALAHPSWAVSTYAVRERVTGAKASLRLGIGERHEVGRMSVDAVMRTAPVIPVLVIEDPADAVPLAEALVGGGLPILEVTLRTPAALDAIRAMREVPGAIVGAGTVLNERQLAEAQAAGAAFVVSPGLTESLSRAARASSVAYLPGVANAGDIMRGLDLGLTHFKFFPADAVGGLKALKAYAAVFREVRFCPTGGITAETAPAWLAEAAVLCVGGSWLVPAGPLDYRLVHARAAAATAL